jgi:asparagine synthase (glutamine-hydrolysing)
MEFYLDAGKLIPEAVWQREITLLQEEVAKESPHELEALKREWLSAFERAIVARASKDQINGLLFSGGVDSTFIGHILAKNNIPFTCYTAGFKDPRTKDPEDIIEAKRVAAHYGWEHRYRVLTLEELKPVVQQAVAMLEDAANPVSVGVGAVVIAAAQLALSDGVHVLFGGLGSEEIFAGYHRHDKAHKTQGLDAESWRGLLAMYQRDLVRDARIGAALGISVPTPFMDSVVIRLAMQFPSELKIKGEHKKYILRIMATDAGMPEEFAFRPKRAAQYGSRMNKGLARMAKGKITTKTAYLQALQAG